MLGKCWTGALCRYFREAVLPLDPGAGGRSLDRGAQAWILRFALICGGPVPPGSAAGLLLGGLCKVKPTAANSGNICGKTGLER